MNGGQPITGEALAGLWDGDDEPGTAGTRRPDLISLASIEARPVRWLWRNYIPTGMLSMLSGDPGTGKSYLALALAANLTTGRLGDGTKTEPTAAIYMSVENPLAETVRPRFDALGGDARLFYALTAKLIPGEDGLQRTSIGLSDIDILRNAIDQTRAQLLIVDPVQSFLGAGIDLHRSNETRPIMDGLGRLADETGCAILILRHLNKQSGGKAIHRGLGSIDLSGAVRSEMLVGALPDDPETRAMIHVKSNVGALGRAQGFRIDADGSFAWTGESKITAADMLTSPSNPGDHKLIAAVDWLRALLTPGPLLQRKVQEAAEQEGYSYRTLRRAKLSLKIESFREGVKTGWFWRLPADDSTPDDQEGQQEGHTKNLASLGNLASLEEGQKNKEIQANPFRFPRGPKNVFGHVDGHLGGKEVFPIAAPPGAGDSWEPGPEVDVDTSFLYGHNIERMPQ